MQTLRREFALDDCRELYASSAAHMELFAIVNAVSLTGQGAACRWVNLQRREEILALNSKVLHR